MSKIVDLKNLTAALTLFETSNVYTVVGTITMLALSVFSQEFTRKLVVVFRYWFDEFCCHFHNSQNENFFMFSTHLKLYDV